MAENNNFIIHELKDVPLSGWGAEYGAIEKVFFDAETPTTFSSVGITICTGGDKSKIPMHYHNCETLHYVLYGNGMMNSSDGEEHIIATGDTIYCDEGENGAHNFINVDNFPLAVFWVHAYPSGTREGTTWVKNVKEFKKDKSINGKFQIKKLKDVSLSGWGAEYGAIEKVFFDAETPTKHSSMGITLCTSKDTSKIPMHYHNCETSHYILYGNGIMQDTNGKENIIQAGDAIYCNSGKEGAHNFINTDRFPLAILWCHAYPEGTREDTVWL